MQTYKYADALSIVGRQLNRNVEDEYGAAIVNTATNLIWMAYDWRETLSSLPPFYLIPDEQDHGPPAVSVPADFYGLRLATLLLLNSDPPSRFDLIVMQDARETHVRALPHAVSYERARRAFRLFPRVPSNITASTYLVQGTYKRRPLKVLASQLPSAILPFDDIYFDVWVEALKWAAWQVAGDPRAGGVIHVKGQGSQYNGQIALCLDRIAGMAASEGLELGAPILAPREPLTGPTGSSYSPNALLMA